MQEHVPFEIFVLRASWPTATFPRSDKTSLQARVVPTNFHVKLVWRPTHVSVERVSKHPKQWCCFSSRCRGLVRFGTKIIA